MCPVPLGKGGPIHRTEKRAAYLRRQERLAYNRRYQQQPEVKAVVRSRRDKDPVYWLLHGARNRAKEIGIEFALTREDIVIPERCPILDVELKVRTSYAPSLDRIDKQKGYIPGNVRVISHRANWRKGDMTLEQARRLVAYMEGKLPPHTLH